MKWLNQDKNQEKNKMSNKPSNLKRKKQLIAHKTKLKIDNLYYSLQLFKKL